MKNLDYYEKFLAQHDSAIGGADIVIWGDTRLGREVAECLLARGRAVRAFVDGRAEADAVEITRRRGLSDVETHRVPLRRPGEFRFSASDFVVVAARKSHAEILDLLSAKGTRGAAIAPWMEEKSLTDPEFLLRRNRELRNLAGVLYSFQEYQSDLIVDGTYRNALVVTTAVGCPVRCRYCPQDEFVKAYNRRPNPVKRLDFASFRRALEIVPTDVIVSFTGMVEPFANPECLDMILHTLNRGYTVRVFSTMYNQTIDAYDAFRDHENLKTFDLHLPDRQHNTLFPLTPRYLELLEHIAAHKPRHGRFWTSCHGVDGGPREEIRGIIDVPGNPVNSIHGLAYDNCLDHRDARLSCRYDCSRLDNPAAGIAMLMPNGDVSGCTQDWELLHVIGNIFEADSWSALMGSAARRRFIAALSDASIPSICRKCELAVKVGESDIN